MKINRFITLQALLFGLFSSAAWYPLSTKLSQTAAITCIVAFGIAAVASIIVYVVVYNGLRSRPRLFISYVMIGMLTKMGAGIASIAAVGYFLNEHVKPFAVAFLIGYLIFTGTEVSFLVKEARKTD